jgi:hypothetical protein
VQQRLQLADELQLGHAPIEEILAGLFKAASDGHANEFNADALEHVSDGSADSGFVDRNFDVAAPYRPLKQSGNVVHDRGVSDAERDALKKANLIFFRYDALKRALRVSVAIFFIGRNLLGLRVIGLSKID